MKRERVIAALLWGCFLFLIFRLELVKQGVTLLLSLLSPFLYGLGLAYLFYIPMAFLEKKLSFLQKKERIGPFFRPFCLVVSVLFILGIPIAAILFIFPQLKDAFFTLTTKLPFYFEKAKDFLITFFSRYDVDLSQFRRIVMNENWFGDGLFSFFRETAVSDEVTSVAGEITGATSDFLFGFVLAIYFLLEKERIFSFLRRLFLSFLSASRAKKLFRFFSLLNEVFYGFFTGQAAEALILGGLAFLGMTALGIPYAAACAVVIGITSFIPLVGAFIGVAFGFLLILTLDPVRAVVFLVFIFLLQQVEGSLIYPKVVGKKVGLPGVAVLGAVIVGGKLSGLLGILLSVPLCGVFYVLLKNWMQRRNPPFRS